MTPGLKNEKKNMRRFMGEKRQSLSLPEKGQKDLSIRKKLLSFVQNHAPLPVLTFISTDQEIDTHTFIEILWKEKIPVAVPKVEGKEIFFYEIHSWEDVASGHWGIWEPVHEQDQVEWAAGIVITPGLVFDKKKNRIGYGGGYYDRFFEKHPNLIKVGVGYSFQLVEKIPVEDTDIPLDFLITD